MEMYGTIRVFNTANFEVRVDALYEPDADFSFEGGEEAYEKVCAGELVCFCARVAVIYRPNGRFQDGDLGAIGESYLGNCIYESIADFEDHRECGAETRRLRAEGSDAVCGSYFADMIREAIAEARAHMRWLQGGPPSEIYIREV